MIDALRMKIIISNFNIKTNFLDLTYNNVMGFFFTAVTPLAAGGQPYQIWHLNESLGVDYEHGMNIMVSRFLETMFTNFFVAIFFYNSIISSLRGGRISVRLIQLGLITSLIVTLFILVLFVRSRIIIKIVRLLEKIKFFRKKNWSLKLENWIVELKKSIRFLWNEKLYIMILDILLGVGLLIVQAYSLYYFVDVFTPDLNISYWKIFGGMAILNMVVFYLPTPGASGSMEGAYHIFLSSLTGNSKIALTAVFGWRFSSYYMQIIFGSLLLFINNAFIKRR
ncbi:hypothetical protein SAMN04488588_1523 [Geotoga petraea]|uniref:Flippase-like domain-containing protein n=1 Tax=Geotoga petraea TaxID=28234 RepID=A0A1G6N745_9BACT|nr:hypothetical protein SAMN04488588_1523 [Geotoga petraea]